MPYEFTKRRFLEFPQQTQHKKCAEILRSIYELSLSNQNDCDLYLQLADWMDLPTIAMTDIKQVADRYHSHLKQAKIFHKEHHLLPTIRQGDREKGEAPWPIAIYLDRLRSAHNIGSILRTVEALSLGSVYFSEEMPFTDHHQVQKASMGASEWIECHQGISIKTLPKPLIVMETAQSAHSLYQFDFPDRFTFVMGNEEYGCSNDILAMADHLVEIPMRGRKNSLNVANAFAIAASEIQRQKSHLQKGSR